MPTLTPEEAAGFVLNYHCTDAEYAASLALDAIRAAGYVVVGREQYLTVLSDYATLTMEGSRK